MLSAIDLVSGYYGTPVVRGVNLEVEAGEIVALMGRNGAGKTTLLRTLMGLIPAQSGSVYLDGRDVTRKPAYFRARAGMGYVPQGRQVFPALSVRDNLLVGAKGHTRKAVEREIERVLESFPALRAKVSDVGGSLSGGQQQMLAIARALIPSPRVLLLDEPCEGLQPSIIEELLVILRPIAHGRRLAVLLVEQNLEFAANLAGRAYLMNKGEIVHQLDAATVAVDKGLQRQYLGV